MSTILLEDYLDDLYKLIEQEDTEQQPDQASELGDEQAPAEIDTLTKEQLRYVLKNSKGKIMTLVFKKKDGTMRMINTRTGVTKNIKGTGLAYDPDKYGYVILWDLRKGNYRTVNINTVTLLKSAGKTYTITETLGWKPLLFKHGGITLEGGAAWNKWKRWADLNRKDDFLYKVLDSIKRQGYKASAKQQQVLVNWFNKKR
jgi:hypothetical protein